jgi:GDP-4-dehydro-6-deoxy-D-mannose reductase
MRSLVTGVCGFVGPYLASDLLAANHEVLGIVRSPINQTSLLPNLQVGLGDLLDVDFINKQLDSFSPNLVFHLAGLSFVPTAERDFGLALKANVEATDNLLRALKANSLARSEPIRVLLVSTSEVYGRVPQDQLPITEVLPTSPANNYGLSKLMMELLAKKYQSELLSIVVARPFNHIGPKQSSDFVAASFARQIAQAKLGKRAPTIVVGNLDAYRDFMDVRDTVRAYKLILDGEFETSGVFNICSGIPTKISRILEVLIEQSGIDIDVSQDPKLLRPSENPYFYGSSQKLKAATGWEAITPLEDTLRDVLNYWLTVEAA